MGDEDQGRLKTVRKIGIRRGCWRQRLGEIENWRERTKMRDIGDPRKIWRPKQGLERGMGS